MWIRFWTQYGTTKYQKTKPISRYEWRDDAEDNDTLNDIAHEFMYRTFRHTDEESWAYSCGFERLTSLPDDIRLENIKRIEKTINAARKELQTFKKEK